MSGTRCRVPGDRSQAAVTASVDNPTWTFSGMEIGRTSGAISIISELGTPQPCRRTHRATVLEIPVLPADRAIGQPGISWGPLIIGVKRFGGIGGDSPGLQRGASGSVATGTLLSRPSRTTDSPSGHLASELPMTLPLDDRVRATFSKRQSRTGASPSPLSAKLRKATS
jgi:hypothetical protein